MVPEAVESKPADMVLRIIRVAELLARGSAPSQEDRSSPLRPNNKLNGAGKSGKPNRRVKSNG